MVVKLTKLKFMYGSMGKRLMFRSICFLMVLALMPLLYIVQDAGPCDLSAGSEPFYDRGGLGIESPNPTKFWTLRPTVTFYSGIYRDLFKQGLLRPGLKGLCVGCGAAHAVLALKENGIPDATGIDRGSCKGKLKRLPFADNSFDFVLSGSVLRARAPALFAVEIERTLKPSGIAIIVLSPRRVIKGSKPLNSLNPTTALFRNSEVVRVTVVMNSSVIALRKISPASNHVRHCSPLKHNRNLVKLAGPLMEDHTNAIYLPGIVTLSPLNRHVYVEIGVNGTESSISEWFVRAYPKQNRAFEIYAIAVDEEVPASAAFNLSGVESLRLKQSKIGGWMKRNLSEKDFVVVKAGFPYARRLMESGAICLVDELFVLCGHDHGEDGATACVYLLKDLRKNGVFAHKW